MRGGVNEPMHPIQVEGFRRMTPAQKLRMVEDLYEAGIRLRVAGFRLKHPDWSDERVDFEARRSLLYAGTQSARAVHRTARAFRPAAAMAPVPADRLNLLTRAADPRQQLADRAGE